MAPKPFSHSSPPGSSMSHVIYRHLANATASENSTRSSVYKHLARATMPGNSASAHTHMTGKLPKGHVQQ